MTTQRIQLAFVTLLVLASLAFAVVSTGSRSMAVAEGPRTIMGG